MNGMHSLFAALVGLIIFVAIATTDNDHESSLSFSCCVNTNKTSDRSIGERKEHKKHENEHHNEEQPESTEANVECIACFSNSSMCCTNQPYTWDNSNDQKPFCCSLTEECCGESCCKPGEVCCSGWRETGTCCSVNQTCQTDGTCLTHSTHYYFYDYNNRPFFTILFVVLFAVCCGMGWRVRTAMQLRRQISQQRQDSEWIELWDSRLYADEEATYNLEDAGLPAPILNSFPVIAFHKSGALTSENGNENEIESQTQPLITDEKACSICIEDYKEDDGLRILPCSHMFHAECIDMWLAKQTTCPLCKLDLLDLEEDN